MNDNLPDGDTFRYDLIVRRRRDRVPFFVVGQGMPDPQARIKRYQDRAEECMNIADTIGDPVLRGQYMRVAETYLQLVQIELNNLSGRSSVKSPS